jgi:hypothetical protein
MAWRVLLRVVCDGCFVSACGRAMLEADGAIEVIGIKRRFGRRVWR